MADERPTVDTITERITVVRGQRVMLDLKRNQGRFPIDFAFKLTVAEWRGVCPQIAGTLQRTRRLDNPPVASTEHGCLMLSNVLRSPRAVEVSVLVVRAFVRMRSVLAANAELAARVDELGRELKRQGGKLVAHDQAILKLLAEIRRLTTLPEPNKRQIGLTAKW